MEINSHGRELFKLNPEPKMDIDQAAYLVCELVEVIIHENEFNALVSLAMSMGESVFSRCRLLNTINNGDIVSAADLFLEYTNGGDKALLRLRKAEKRVFIKLPPLKVVSNRGKNDNIAKSS